MRGLAALAAPKVEERLSSPWDANWGLRPGTQGVDQWSAFNLSAVWACETLIADALATLPVGTFRAQGATRTATTPPVWLETPNPENNRIDYETQRMLSLLGWGNAYTWLRRQRGTFDLQDPVIERWLLSPAHVTVQRVYAENQQSPLRYFLRGQEIHPNNMQHIRGDVLPGQYLGMSVIQYARKGLGMTLSAENAGVNLYDQGMHQSGVLEVPQLPAEASEEVVDRLRDQFSERYAGSGNAGKPMVLVGGTKWNGTMLTPSDAEYLETRKFQINEICRWFRVPPHKIADIIAHASQGGGMGIEQQATEFAQDTLLSWVNRLELADSALVPRGQYVKYNLNAYVRADLATRFEAYTKARLGGWMNADQVCALEDLPPLPDGKGQIFLQPANYIEAGTTIAAVPEPPVPEPPAPGANDA